MNLEVIKTSAVKELRLAKHWSQEELAIASGLSIRTIQRIENGNKVGFESLKALAAVFQLEIKELEAHNKQEQIDKETEYVHKIKGLYTYIVIAIVSLLVPFYLVIMDTFTWMLFLGLMAAWVVIIAIYVLNSFNVFCSEWERKVIERKFK